MQLRSAKAKGLTRLLVMAAATKGPLPESLAVRDPRLARVRRAQLLEARHGADRRLAYEFEKANRILNEIIGTRADLLPRFFGVASWRTQIMLLVLLPVAAAEQAVRLTESSRQIHDKPLEPPGHLTAARPQLTRGPTHGLVNQSSEGLAVEPRASLWRHDLSQTLFSF